MELYILWTVNNFRWLEDINIWNPTVLYWQLIKQWHAQVRMQPTWWSDGLCWSWHDMMSLGHWNDNSLKFTASRLIADYRILYLYIFIFCTSLVFYLLFPTISSRDFLVYSSSAAGQCLVSVQCLLRICLTFDSKEFTVMVQGPDNSSFLSFISLL